MAKPNSRKQFRQGTTKFRQVRRAISSFLRSLLRQLYSLKHKRWKLRQRSSQSGFVIPTAMMLLLVLSLIISSMLIRTVQRTEQVMERREELVIYNAAAPAIDRAKSKIEYLFSSDPRGLTSDVPSEARLEAMMLNRDVTEPDGSGGTNTVLEAIKDDTGNPVEVYDFPDETRLELPTSGGTPKRYNAWSFQVDKDGDGVEETTIAYSILMKTENEAATVTMEQSTDEDKALNQVNRSGPLNIQSDLSAQENCDVGELIPAKGWYGINGVSLRKNFQVNVVVANSDPDNTNPNNENVSTLEYYQDREADRGNKWGAWFRYDLEIYPGPEFRFNGAMHSESNFILSANEDNEKVFEGYLVSSPKSCIYSPQASRITLTKQKNTDGSVSFKGQWIAGHPARGQVTSGAANEGGYIHKLPDTTNSSDSFTTKNLQVNVKHNYYGSGDDTQGDSVTIGNSVEDYYGATVDPFSVFTEDLSKSRGGDHTNDDINNPDWDELILSESGRTQTEDMLQPFVDDTYRADNRWGPRPRYNEGISLPSKDEYGELITEANVLEALTTNSPATGDLKDLGLDGYWERRATKEGLRLIVGQRLELGNPFGWDGDKDPLYPYKDYTGDNLDLQRRTVRDNLAAVQATAVYHHEVDQGQFPVAVLATTSHPGTAETWEDSTTFNFLPYDVGTATDRVNTDFFTGTGTNGWEFAPPSNNKADFETAIDTANSALRLALNNLAHFAGDPQGAFPPTQDKSSDSAVIHPYPYFTMWGDFSNLRRIMEERIGAGVTYDNLSIAEQSTLHTAASALGMLAYNIENKQAALEQDGSGNPNINRVSDIDKLANKMWQLMDGNPSNGEIANIQSLTFQDYLESLEKELNPADRDDAKAALKAIEEAMQIKRGRAMGFVRGKRLKFASAGSSSWNSTDGQTTIGSRTFTSGCDPEEFADLVTDQRRKTALAVAICSEADLKPRYPALYYLFPTTEHDHLGRDATDTDTDYPQPLSEEYVSNNYVQTSNQSFDYQPLNNTALNTIALKPRPNSQWKLPFTTTDPGSGTNPNVSKVFNNRNKIQGNALTTAPTFLGLQDKAFYNGRELMQVRTLDLNLDLLRKNQVNGGDSWLPSSGIVYAFREDAVREDAIARPALKACNFWTVGIEDRDQTIISKDCRMSVVDDGTNKPQDPPINTENHISPKPVDYFPDPDRRPYGFRLKNGADLGRDGSKAGMSFISDNPVYIQGNFNLHDDSSTGTENTIQEFDERLADDWNNFYSRNTLNTNFARTATDNWRPTEIMADAITIISNKFCDGFLEDGLNPKKRRKCEDSSGTKVPNSQSSYISGTLADMATYNNAWTLLQREDDGNPRSPVRIERDGKIWKKDRSDFFTDYQDIDDISNRIKYLSRAEETTVNAVLINGIVPTRQYQSYGGLHNFPRLLENWQIDSKNKIPLNIQGSFLQINFSVYGTAPFDQDVWNISRLSADKDLDSSNTTSLAYYGAPLRKWGYDVALQYQPAAPISERFITVGTPRNEFYLEKPTEDPYNQILFCAKEKGTSEPIYPDLCNLP